MRPVIIVFAKAPRRGRVKTRLAPVVPAPLAVKLHECFVLDMLELAFSVAFPVDVELYTDVETTAWAGYGVRRKLQPEGDLGDRLRFALEDGLREGRPSVLVLGSDSPTLPRDHLRQMLENPADVTLGPADDGGYYAIQARRMHPRIFDGVAWSTERALADTMRQAKACGLTVALGPSWFDVDEPDDLVRLAASDALPPHTARWLIENGFRSRSKASATPR